MPREDGKVPVGNISTSNNAFVVMYPVSHIVENFALVFCSVDNLNGISSCCCIYCWIELELMILVDWGEGKENEDKT